MPIEMKNVCFNFDSLYHPLFENVNITVDTTWRLGLFGRNGRGKTTLLRLLMEQYSYTGKITSDVDFVYFPLKIKSKKKLTFYAIDELVSVELWKLERECHLLSLDRELLWKPFEQLSGGEQTKVLLAALFCEESKYPLLDEPTNHLDLHTRKIVANYLKKKKGYIIVSHDQNFVDDVVDHILVIEKRQLAILKGNFTKYEQQKMIQDQFEIEQNRNLKSEIERLKKTAREKSDWANKKEKLSGNDSFGKAQAKRMMKRSQAIAKRTEEKIEEKTKLLQNIETVSDLTANCLFSHRTPVLRVRNFTLFYGDRPLFKPITFELCQGEQLALIGPNGSGKTSILNYIIKQPFAGSVSGETFIPKELSKSIIRQNYDNNSGSLKNFAGQNAIDYSLFLSNLRLLGMERDMFDVQIEQMSSGQKKKVELAKSLGIPAEFYIWDEPLNYLDVFNHEQIETMILKYKPTLLFIEHDEKFLSKIASKVVEIIPY